VLWHGAERALRESFGFDGKGAVETGAGVFPSDDGGEFDELALGKPCEQFGVEIVRHVSGSARQHGGEAQYEFFRLAEMGTRFKLRDVLKLLLGDPLFSADGRMNVDSKRAAHHKRHFDLH
jgi:hypothetical protein